MRDLLDNGMKAYKVADIVGGDVTISTLPPDRVNTSGAEDPNQLNVFMYQVTPNQGWRNVGLPTRNGNGNRISDNPLALNLHYLLTAYGSKALFAEIVLGYAMQLLHESPVLTRDAIRKALAPAVPPPDFPPKIVTSELADQAEQLRIIPEILNTEDISKLWTAMQVHYRPTAAYQVVPVLIESTRPAKIALPVAARNAYVVTFDQPNIDSVAEKTGESAPITVGSTLLVKGRNLKGTVTQIMVGGLDLTAAISDLRDSQITLPLPGPLPAGMHAGIQT